MVIQISNDKELNANIKLINNNVAINICVVHFCGYMRCACPIFQIGICVGQTHFDHSQFRKFTNSQIYNGLCVV